MPKMRRKLVITIVVALLTLSGGGLYLWLNRQSPQVKPSSNDSTFQKIPPQDEPTNEQSTPEPTPPPVAIAPPGFNKSLYSIDDPTSPWVIVNKKRPLPETYAPADLSTIAGGQLRSLAASALNDLIIAGKAAGQNLQIISSYRSFSTQSITYNGYVARDGQATADTYSARPGHSEHQTGLAVDLGSGSCNLEICFGDTPAGKWLAANAPNYGFIIRYPNGKTQVTGYQYEPWHIRYVGKELAVEIKAKNVTLEEFFGLPAAPNY